MSEGLSVWVGESACEGIKASVQISEYVKWD